MFFSKIDVLLQEVPGEISLTFFITGCSLGCKGCHSSFLFKESNGFFLENYYYEELLLKYKGYVSCVLFMGGEWNEISLVNKLKKAKEMGYKTCLYTGLEKVSNSVLQELDWVKTGRWVSDLGGLESKITNQIFREVKTNKKLNFLFQKI